VAPPNHPLQRSNNADHHARARAGHHVEVPRHAQHVVGRETWWEGSIDPIPMEGGNGLLVTAREVTGALPADGVDLGHDTPRAGSRAERLLRASEERFRRLVEQVTVEDL
jgi:hypothetical protein